MYRNSEGYPDPTAGPAIANIMREQRRAARAKRRKAEQKHRKTNVHMTIVTKNNRRQK